MVASQEDDHHTREPSQPYRCYSLVVGDALEGLSLQSAEEFDIQIAGFTKWRFPVLTERLHPP
jgi:hypothetical protein